jgi:hypothetical protein
MMTMRSSGAACLVGLWVAACADPGGPAAVELQPAPLISAALASGAAADEPDPVVTLIGYSGDLCPPGSLMFDGGLMYSTQPNERIKRATKQRCDIQMTVSVPPGRELQQPVICSEAYAYKALTAPAELSYAIGDREVPSTRAIPGPRDAEQQCDTLNLVAADCDDPSNPRTVNFTIGIGVDVPAGNAVQLVMIDAMLSPRYGTVWSSCGAR